MFFWDSWQKALLLVGMAIALILALFVFDVFDVGNISGGISLIFVTVVFFGSWVAFESSSTILKSRVDSESSLWSEDTPDAKRYRELCNRNASQIGDKMVTKIADEIFRPTRSLNGIPRTRTIVTKRKRRLKRVN